ncbi:hypothetical protein [Cupriavidus sp. AU9028]|uniref:hypothetical protein n=1 Tax=Cupriavidus sp. AU9028 TaxID=2871157 RepID=UPI001C977392|nr:hypothetical protein [Cupriavidus sp. AU9028]MBY4896876.1 hypothetical protein [Cupriavidus sp. AU9028]
MHSTSLFRLAALACSGAMMLAAAGCDRSQPGPKPISGDAGTSSAAQPALSGGGATAPNASEAPAR